MPSFEQKNINNQDIQEEEIDIEEDNNNIVKYIP